MKNHQRISIIEPLVINREHVTFNTLLIQLVSQATNHKKIDFYAEKKHLAEVKNALSLAGENIELTFNEIIPAKRLAGFLTRFIIDFFRTLYLLSKLPKINENLVIFTSANTPTIFSIKLATLILRRRNIDIHIFLHSELEKVWGWQSRNPLRRFFQIRSALSFPFFGSLKYFVLEEAIMNELILALPNINHLIRTLPHPIFEFKNLSKSTLSTPINFGFLGVASKSKGFNLFCSVANNINKLAPGKARFHAIGRIAKDETYDDHEMAGLTTRPAIEPLPMKDYISLVESLHYIVLPLTPMYNHVASGTLLDALAFNRPLIVTDIAIARAIFDEFGEIGKICKNSEFESTITELILKLDTLIYSNQIENIKLAANSRTYVSLSNTYRKIMNNYAYANCKQN